MLFAEALVLISLDPDGTPARTGTIEYVDVGAAGALVAELALHGRMRLEDGRVVVDPGPGPASAHPLLAAADEALARIAGRKLRTSMGKLTKTAGRSAVVDHLVATGVVGRERAGLRPTRHPVLARGEHEALLADLRAAAVGTGPLTPQQAVVLALAGPCRLLEVVAPERADHPVAKRRIAEATAQVPVTEPVRRAIEDAIAAAVGAVAVVTVASSS